jgi:lipopolysaccharide export system protein LptA
MYFYYRFIMSSRFNRYIMFMFAGALACLLMLCAFPVHAQKIKKIKLVHANSLEKTPGIEAKRLIGNVEFEHNEVHMYCDSAYLYDNNSLDAYGNVHIRQGDTLHLYGETLKYNGNDKKAEIQKNIRMTDRDMVLTTDFLTYDLGTSVATYTTGGKIVNKDNTLTSEHGYYYSNSKTLSFKKNVVLVNPQYVMNCDTLLYNVESKVAWFLGPTTIKSNDNLIYCENGFYDTNRDVSQFNQHAYIITREQYLKGDSIYYDRKKGYGKAMRNVSIIDSAQNINITGDLAEHFEGSENSIVTGKAVLMQVYEGDTLFLHGDTLRAAYANNKGEVRPLQAAVEKTEKPKGKKNKKGTPAPKITETRIDTIGYPHRMLFAYHHVKFFKNDMQGKCDSLVYSYKDSTMRLYEAPVLWSEQNQLSGEEIEIGISRGKIRSMEIRNTAFISSQEDSAKFNQVKGKLIRGYFVDNQLSKIRVEGNGQTIYFAKDKNTLIGVNKAVCSDILIYMKDNDVQKITFITQPDATLYPLRELSPNDMILEDFRWRGDERPLTRKDIFKW